MVSNVGRDIAPSPEPGDAFGAALLAELEGGDGSYVEERDDGYVWPAGAGPSFTKPDAWPAVDRRILARVAGRVLDVGAGRAG